jgi:putative ABC transport system ATP-binding protein
MTEEVMDILKFCVDEYKQTLVMITHNDEISKIKHINLLK